MKRLAVIFLAMVLLMTGTVFASGEIKVILNGEELVFDVSPFIMNDRTMVPIRAIFEGLGADVYWDEATYTAYAINEAEGKGVAFTVGSPFIIDINMNAVPIESPAIIREGRIFVPLRAVSEAFGCDVSWNGETKTVTVTGENFVDFSAAEETQEVIEAGDASELVKSIGSNRRIVLTGEKYDLSELGALKVYNVVNMTIEGNAEICIDDIYEDVMYFEKCGKITLKGLKVGHTLGNDSYECEGAVTRFDRCREINIENCSLYGCGAFGVYADAVTDLSVKDSKIYDCTYTGIWLTGNSEALVSGTEFCDSRHASGFIRVDNSDIVLKDCNIHDIVTEDFGGFIETFDFDEKPSSVRIENCRIYNNEFKEIANPALENLVFEGCVFENNKGSMSHPAAVFGSCEIK